MEKRLMLIVLFLFSISLVSATDCYISSDCGLDKEVIYVSGISNAHVSSNGIQGYLKLCCLELIDATIEFTNTGQCTGASALWMSSASNAHISEVGVTQTYQKELCLTSTDTIECDEVHNGFGCSTLGEDYFCLLKYQEVSGWEGTGTNAHVADCLDTFYRNRICCSVGVECSLYGEQCNTLECCPGLDLYCMGTTPNKGCCYGNQEWIYDDFLGWHCEETGGCNDIWSIQNQNLGSSYLVEEEICRACCDPGQWQIVQQLP